MITVRVAEPARRGVPLSVAVTTSLRENIQIYIHYTHIYVYLYIYIYIDTYKCLHLYSRAIARLNEVNDSLCFCPDLSVHYGSSGDSASQWVNLKQTTHGR